jgi:hypothetical protein
MLDSITPRLYQTEPLRRCELHECRAACCLHGVWVDALEVKELLANASLIKPHLPPDRQDPEKWFAGREEPDDHSLSGRVIHTTVLSDPGHYGGTSCIFLRQDFKCALQVASEASGYHPWRFKPFYCILHPLDLDKKGRITLDKTQALLEEPASCLRPADKPIPLAQTFAPELKYLLGDRAYQQLIEHINRPVKEQYSDNKPNPT